MRKFVLLAFAGLCGVASAQNLVVNPGFETGDLTGWSVTHAGSFSGVSTNNDGGVPHSGSFFAYFGAVSASDAEAFNQTIATTAGSQYSVSFWAADLFGPGDVNANITVTFGGNTVANTIPVGTAYQQYSGTFTATGSSTVLAVSGWEASAYIDADDFDVHVVSTPEPASLAVLGLGAILLIRRRRRKA